LSAGASFTPSPVIATTSPQVRNASMIRSLSRRGAGDDVDAPQPLDQRGGLEDLQLGAGQHLVGAQPGRTGARG
jgi:hypothetical protein